jgi:antirestriction protein ArdC
MKIADLYAKVTSDIIRDLEAGVAPWVRPWKNAKATGIMPHNGATNRPYNGVNVLLLWSERQEKGYTTSNWMTYKQAIQAGGQVRGGEKSTTVVFTKKLRVKDQETEEEKTVGMLRTYAVFNEDQIDGLTPKDPEILAPEARVEAVDAFLAATGSQVRLGGNQPMYVPSLDFMALPHMQQFRSPEHFYATSLHEHCHWTGAKDRLNRDLSKRFGTKAYAAEELIAELGAAFLCAHLNIQGELRHADYIGTWIGLLKEDDRAIFTAASKASQAVDFLRAFSEPQELEEVV